MVHYRGGRAAIDAAVYPDIDEFWDDLADAYADEIQRLADLGCTYLQLDDTSLAYLNDPAQRAEFDARGERRRRTSTSPTSRTINRALADRPAGMAVTTHMCRGNFRSSLGRRGRLRLRRRGAVRRAGGRRRSSWSTTTSARAASSRCGSCPAASSSCSAWSRPSARELESKDDLKRRIEEAARYIDLDQLCLSPQCGFSSTKEGNSLTFDEQRAKLALVVETAEEVWGTS